ncbi:MAG: hypothetical protein G8237_00385 [Magnetococcales bacterium]|nr:TerD family protein [Magnetococcales bacterium]NGZ04796.1 hypothetical protein [Magnetococcales bacterium]
MELERGQRLSLEQLVDIAAPFVIGMGIHVPGMAVDCVCFGLDDDKKASDDRYAIFFNQPVSPCTGIALAAPHGYGLGFELVLARLPESLAALVVVVTLDEPYDFSRLEEGEVCLMQKGVVTARFVLQAALFAHQERALLLLELYRKDGSWRINTLGQGFAGGLAALADHYGVVTREEDRPSLVPAPPLSLLPLDDLPVSVEDAEAVERMQRAIERTLGEFNVKGQVVGADVGPVVTTYKLDPAPGVKVTRVTGLEADLALSLSSPGLRIDPLFTDGVIGIEIPNRQRAVVPLRRILTGAMGVEPVLPLLMPLGVDARGQPVLENLELLPHLLVAGTTRSGKSVLLHAVLCGVLLRARVEQARLLLVDPKRNEFSLYDGVPHLLAPVVTEPRRALAALQWLTGEMESRYQRMNGLGVRNLQGWQTKRSDAVGRGGTLDPVPLPPPVVLVVVDELADLMLQSGKAIEEPLVRLAQMGRAAGIHLVLATQRPTRDVVTGLIKSNIPARLAFKVTSKLDSRVILDEGGAENLLGQGDGLFIAPGRELRRIQAPMVSEEDVTAIVRFLRTTVPMIPEVTLMEALEAV